MVCTLFLLSFVSAIDTSTCPASMVSYWKFDGPQAEEIIDSYGNNPGSIGGGSISGSWANVGNSLNIPNARATITIPDHTTLKPSSELTIEFWIKSDTPTALMPLNFPIKKTGYDISISPTTNKFVINVGTTSFESATTYTPSTSGAETEYFIAITWDKVTKDVILYINGAEDKKVKTPHPRATDARSRGIKFPISNHCKHNRVLQHVTAPYLFRGFAAYSQTTSYSSGGLIV